MHEFLAKSSKNNSPPETIQEHTNKLLELFQKFAQIYGIFFEDKNELELIKNACAIHDLGKMNSAFQKKIHLESGLEYNQKPEITKLFKSIKNNEIPHGILSCCFLDTKKLKTQFSKLEVNVLATAIYHHHTRDFLDENGELLNFKLIEPIVEQDLKSNAKRYDANIFCEYDGIDENKLVGNILKYTDNYSFYLKFIVVKGMLNKLDYAASAGLEKLEIESVDAGEFVNKKFVEKSFSYNDCQNFMIENCNNNIVVIASTGIGKTEGALLWAKKAKTFYTLPIKVSINAIYKRIINEQYYESQRVTFLHSDTKSMMLAEEENNNYDSFLKYAQTRHLTYPLTICTIDQLFYFVFKSLGTEKFPATLKYSKIIIDEIQSYSADITAFIIYGLKVLTDLGGKFCIMTATLPPIVEHFLDEVLNQNNNNKKYIKAPNVFFKKDVDGKTINRHFIEYIESDFDYAKIIEKAKIEKVLVICNTVKRSQTTYLALKEIDNKMYLHLLHSRFILKDRKIKEKNIQDFAPNKKEKNNNVGIWISTQIVEASLDIDFDVLFTDMCTADSLLQRMGRCYRDRSYKKNMPNVFIYKNKDEKSLGVGSVYDKEIFAFSVEQIKKYSGANFTEEQKVDYINNVYAVEKVKNTEYAKTIKKNIETLECLPLGAVDKNVTERQFRNIQNITVMPQKFYKKMENKNVFDNYKNVNKYDKKILIRDKIMQYTTSVHLYLKKDSTKIPYTDFNDIYISNNKYDSEIGLQNEVDDELVWESKCL